MGQYENKSIIGLCLSIIVIMFGYSFYRYIRLKDGKYTYAVYYGPVGSATMVDYIIEFKTCSGKKIKTGINYNRKIKIGDTIWIKYSINDPAIAEVIDTDYKKYLRQGLRQD